MVNNTLQQGQKRGLNASMAGAILVGSGVALGAFGAHALQNTLNTELQNVYETGVRYQMYGGLGLLALGFAPGQRRAPTWLFAGTLVFSVSLYLLALTGQKWLGAVTPIGGVLQLVGWGLAAWDFRQR